MQQSFEMDLEVSTMKKTDRLLNPASQILLE